MSDGNTLIVKNLLESCCRNNAHVLVVLEIITSLPELEDKLINSQSICKHNLNQQCIVSELTDILISIKRHQEFRIEKINEIFMKALAFSSEMEYLQRTFNFVFNAFHRCTNGGDIGSPLVLDESFDCDFECPVHSCCGLSVIEKYLCGCGQEEIFKWDPSNFFITFDFCSYLKIFETQIDLGSTMNNLEKQINDNFLGKLKYSDTMIAYLATLIQKANVENCPNPTCSIRSSSVTFELSKSPEILFIAVKNSKKYSPQTSFLQIVSINNSFDIADLFIAASQEYVLEGMILETNTKIPVLVQKYKDKWKIGTEEVYFEEIIRRVANYSMRVSIIIYKKSNRRNRNIVNSPRNLEVKSPKSIKPQINCFKVETNEIRTDEIDQVNAEEKIYKSYNQEKALAGRVPESLTPKNRDFPENDRKILSSHQEIEIYKSPYRGNALEGKGPESLTPKNKDFPQNDREISSSHKTMDYNPLLGHNYGRNAKDKNSIESKYRGPPYSESSNNATNKKSKEWTCKCKIVNDDSFKVCQGCFQPRTGLKGWACPYCTTFNESSSYRCEACYKYKDMHGGKYNSVRDTEEEYWHCYSCLSLNVRNHIRCSNCKEFKPDI